MNGHLYVKMASSAEFNKCIQNFLQHISEWIYKLQAHTKTSFSNGGSNPKESRFTLFPPKLKEWQVLPCPFTDNRPTVTPTPSLSLKQIGNADVNYCVEESIKGSL